MFEADFGGITSEFWVKYFKTPNDNITKLYFELVPKFEGLLPASFEGGVANLELNQEYTEQIKQIPLYSKLLNGDYETNTSKRDKKYSISYKFYCS